MAGYGTYLDVIACEYHPVSRPTEMRYAIFRESTHPNSRQQWFMDREGCIPTHQTIRIKLDQGHGRMLLAALPGTESGAALHYIRDLNLRRAIGDQIEEFKAAYQYSSVTLQYRHHRWYIMRAWSSAETGHQVFYLRQTKFFSAEEDETDMWIDVTDDEHKLLRQQLGVNVSDMVWLPLGRPDDAQHPTARWIKPLLLDRFVNLMAVDGLPLEVRTVKIRSAEGETTMASYTNNTTDTQTETPAKAKKRGIDAAKDQGKALGKAVGLGVGLAALDQAGEAFLDIARTMAKDVPMLTPMLDHPTGREGLKVLGAIIVQSLCYHTELMPKSETVAKVCEAQIAMSSFKVAGPHLADLRKLALVLVDLAPAIAEVSPTLELPSSVASIDDAREASAVKTRVGG